MFSTPLKLTLRANSQSRIQAYNESDLYFRSITSFRDDETVVLGTLKRELALGYELSVSVEKRIPKLVRYHKMSDVTNPYEKLLFSISFQIVNAP